MKVENTEMGFNPITITLETKDEADLMWLRLNTNIHTVLADSEGYLDESKTEKYKQISWELWNKFNGVYDLRR